MPLSDTNSKEAHKKETKVPTHQSVSSKMKLPIIRIELMTLS